MHITTQPTSADPWQHLRQFTAARIALGRSGGSLPTRALLDFRHAHALARDAVQAEFLPEDIATQLHAARIPTDSTLRTQTSDRASFLLRPDLAKALDAPSTNHLQSLANRFPIPPDLVILISDGLSAHAANRHAAAVVIPLIESLSNLGWIIAPVFLIPFARVKLQDQVGSLLHARITLMLLGERPGLGMHDSLGAYFTYQPTPEKTDADRNCVSNIRPEGLPPAAAAEKLLWLLTESHRLATSGVHLKDAQPSTSLQSHQELLG